MPEAFCEANECLIYVFSAGLCPDPAKKSRDISRTAKWTWRWDTDSRNFLTDSMTAPSYYRRLWHLDLVCPLENSCGCPCVGGLRDKVYRHAISVSVVFIYNFIRQQ